MAAHSFDDNDRVYPDQGDNYYSDADCSDYDTGTRASSKYGTVLFFAVLFVFLVTLASLVAWSMNDKAGESTAAPTHPQSQATPGRAANEVRQGDEISGHDGCLIGATDSEKAWVSATCASPGENIATNGTAVGIAGDMTDNGLIPVTLNDGVSPSNMYDDVSVSPFDDNLKGVEVCSMGPDSTIYGCGKVVSSHDGVGRLQGLDNAPAGAPVWLRSSLSDDDSQSAQMAGIVSVTGGGDKESIVSFIPLSTQM